MVDPAEAVAGYLAPAPAPGWDCHVHVFASGAAARRGHYAPAHRPLVEIEALAQAHGCGHLVLVQPSVYGTDNTVLLAALAGSGGRHRGVVVVDADVTEVDLDGMHRLGVRGIRFNLASPVGNARQAPAVFAALAPRLQARGWHVQWYCRPGDIAAVAALHATTTLPCVLDHLGGLSALAPLDPAEWQAAARLADAGAWVKLSGWYRLGAAPPYTALLATVARLAGLFGDRVVWGSDWPHTGLAPGALPPYGSLWQPVLRSLPASCSLIRRQAPLRLYD